MDGRIMRNFVIKLTGDLIRDTQLLARKRSTYLRDFVLRVTVHKAQGPHKKGINVLDRTLAVETRTHQQVKADLASFEGGEVAF